MGDTQTIIEPVFFFHRKDKKSLLEVTLTIHDKIHDFSDFHCFLSIDVKNRQRNKKQKL